VWFINNLCRSECPCLIPSIYLGPRKRRALFTREWCFVFAARIGPCTAHVYKRKQLCGHLHSNHTFSLRQIFRDIAVILVDFGRRSGQKGDIKSATAVCSKWISNWAYLLCWGRSRVKERGSIIYASSRDCRVPISYVFDIFQAGRIGNWQNQDVVLS
jgi:hypothetical protein